MIKIIIETKVGFQSIICPETKIVQEKVIFVILQKPLVGT